MNLHYIITLDGIQYLPTIVDTDGKIMWNKDDSGLLYREYLSGKFVINRSGNETLFDNLLAMGYCKYGFIGLYDQDDAVVVESQFKLIDCDINTDKCRVTISPKIYDKYNCLLKNGEKEFNALSGNIPKYTVNFTYKPQYEFKTCTDIIEISTTIAGIPKMGSDVINRRVPNASYLASCGGAYLTTNYYNTNTGWTFYSSNYVIDSGIDYNVTTVYIREVKKIIRLGSTQTETPTSTGFAWVFQHTVQVGSNTIDVFARPATVDFSQFDALTDTYYVTIDPTDYESYDTDRARKLNDLISALLEECGLDDNWESEFFKSPVNPISGKDLSKLFYMQKSDMIGIISTTDPATKGMITFNKLMEYLKAMFQVYWYIDDNDVFHIEHKDYFTNNLSYAERTFDPLVDFDLNTIYPLALQGTNSWTYNTNIPLYEKFEFMESWTVDFTGFEINYTNCLDEGGTETYSAAEITTDIDLDLFFANASKDGFVMLHCADDTTVGEYYVVTETGAISGLEILNAHLSWANLHENYWVYDRWLDEGYMNGNLTTFETHKKIKQQVEISFPFCPQNFDANKLIRTRMVDGSGNYIDGEVGSAEYSLKKGFIKVQLLYE